MTKISVIIPVYNVENYLNRCLDSLINQTMSDIEIICIDDCSTDNSLEILRQYSERDSRITIIESEKNLGAAVARNKGLKVAKGEFLGFVDPDDAVDLNYYEELYNTAKEKNVEVAKCQRKTYYLDGSVVVSDLNKKIKENIYNFAYEWTTAIYKKSFIDEKNITFPEECPKAQDIVFLARIIYRGATLALNNNVFYHYYKREGSLNASKIPLKHIISALRAKKLILEEINNSSLYDLNLDLYISAYCSILCAIFYNLFKNDSVDSKKLCASAIIEAFYECKDISKLTKIFPYPQMLKYIKNKDVENFANHLLTYKTDIYKPLKWYQNIFSIKNIAKHKVVTICGVKIRLERKGARL